MGKLEKSSKIKITIGMAAMGGIAGFFNSASAQFITKKSPIKNAESYFEYGIFQETANEKPYVTCVTVDDCPVRTVKTLVKKEPVKFIQPAEPRVAVKHEGLAVYFDFAKSNLSATERKALKANIAELKTKRSLFLRAWTDPVGGIGSKYNLNLAKSRAISVRKFLQANGVKTKLVIDYSPPCCVRLDATENSSEEVRREMRVVEIIEGK